MTRVCRNCGASYEDWVTVCADCGQPLVATAVSEDEEDPTDERTLSIEFTLLSGETISVRADLDEPATEEAVQRYADDLFREIGLDTVRKFVYWWEEEFYVDAIRMREVAAVSISTVAPEDDEDESGEYEP
jgi:predicted  nucleic acid-binding Zn-ribbon protein